MVVNALTNARLLLFSHYYIDNQTRYASNTLRGYKIRRNNPRENVLISATVIGLIVKDA